MFMFLYLTEMMENVCLERHVNYLMRFMIEVVVFFSLHRSELVAGQAVI